jgi:DNA-binding GntR family transcriptional regulator
MALERSHLPRTAEGIAANELRAAIVRGDLKPGDKIRQESTAAQLGISLIPLREALKTLAGEGAVTYQPQRGYYVTELPVEAMKEVYDARSLIESEVERIALPRMRPEDVEAMRGHLRAQARAVEDRDAVQMIETNRRFHFELFGRCDNAWLLKFVVQVWDALDPYRVLSYRKMWLTEDELLVPNEILGEHERILTAIEKGKTEQALKLLEKHRNRSETFLTVLVRVQDRE